MVNNKREEEIAEFEKDEEERRMEARAFKGLDRQLFKTYVEILQGEATEKDY